MQNTKLVSTLTTFTKDDWHAVKRHLMAYCDKESDTYAVFEYLYNNKTSLDKLPASEMIVKEKFPHLQVKIFLNHLSKLNQWIEDYLVINYIKKEKYDYDLYLIRAQNKRGLYNNADQTMRKMEKLFNENNTYDLENSKAKWMLTHAQYYSNNPIKYERGAPLLQDLMDYFHSYYKELSLIYKAELINWGRIKNHDYSNTITTLDKSIEPISDTAQSNEIALTVALQEKLDMEILYKIKTNLEKNKYDRSSQLHLIMASYLISRSRAAWKIKLTNDSQLLKLVHEYGLEFGVYSNQEKVSLSIFNNLADVMFSFLSLNEGDAFVEKWITKVETYNKEATLDLCKATNRLRHDKYNEIIQHIRRSDFNYSDKIKAQLFLLIVYYEKRETENKFISNQIINLKNTLKRNKNKFSQERQLSTLNFINFYEILLKNKSKALIYFSDCNNIQYRSWCEKILKQ